MKIIMHIGMPKTGSTAIQFALTKNREQLLNAGVLYPINPGPFSGHAKHSIYVSMLRRGDSEQWNRFPDAEAKIISTYGGSFDFHSYWLDDLKKQIAVAKPHTLVISEEVFFGVLGNKKTKIHENIRKFSSDLNVKSEDLKFVGYLRSPPDYYLSSCQQNLKSTPEIRDIVSANYIPKFRRIIDNYKSHCQIFSFDKKIFPEGDVVRHFTRLFLGLELGSLGKPNETISAPAMSILQDYRSIFYSAENQRQSPREVEFLINALRDGDGNLGLGRPKLRDEVKDAIWHLVESDLKWLNENLGIYFYPSKDRPKTQNMQHGVAFHPKMVEDIVDFDVHQKTRLLLEVIFQLVKKNKTKRVLT